MARRASITSGIQNPRTPSRSPLGSIDNPYGNTIEADRAGVPGYVPVGSGDGLTMWNPAQNQQPMYTPPDNSRLRAAKARNAANRSKGIGSPAATALQSLSTANPANFEREDRIRDERRAALNKGLAELRALMNSAAPEAPVEDPRAAALEFGRAKDIIGKQRLGAVRSFQDSMAGRGFMGSTDEAAGVGTIIAGGLSDIGDVSLQQAQDTINRNRSLFDAQMAARERQRQQALSGLTALYGNLGMI